MLIAAVAMAACTPEDDPNNGGGNNGGGNNGGGNNGGGSDTPVVPTVPTGAINGLFTVNGDGGQVYFSKGSLQ